MALISLNGIKEDVGSEVAIHSVAKHEIDSKIPGLKWKRLQHCGGCDTASIVIGGIVFHFFTNGLEG